jgi:hypothetical protein
MSVQDKVCPSKASRYKVPTFLAEAPAQKQALAVVQTIRAKYC